MDRTSIVGDTIDYMKELLERINSLQQEIHETSNSSEMNVMGLLKDKKQDEIVVRNSSKVCLCFSYELAAQLRLKAQTENAQFVFPTKK